MWLPKPTVASLQDLLCFHECSAAAHLFLFADTGKPMLPPFVLSYLCILGFLSLLDGRDYECNFETSGVCTRIEMRPKG